MDVEVCFYGNLTRLAGGRIQTVRVDVRSPTVSDLREAIARQFPAVAPQMEHTAIGVGTELLRDDAPIRPGAQIALLPPVSGG